MLDNDLLSIIKKAAIEAVEESVPMSSLTGKVIKVNPLTVSITEKLSVDEDFLLIPVRMAKEGFNKNESILLLRQPGGQQYIVLDKLGGEVNDSGVK